MNLTDRVINALTTKRAVFQQGEGAALPYTVDWAVALNGDPIESSSWITNDNHLTIMHDFTATTATASITGLPGDHLITNRITTQGGIPDERQIKLQITRSTEPQTVGADYGLNS